jgi:hypothetical protein
MKAMSNIKELNWEEMSQVSGGYVVDNGTGDKFWIVMQDGTVKGYAPTKEKAQEFAKAYGASQTIMTLEQYKARYGRELKW